MTDRRRLKSWPVLLLALPAFIAIWSGWVDLGRLTGFGVVRPLPGIWDSLRINTAITLPIGLETYAAYALYVWLAAGSVSTRARIFAKRSAAGSLVLGALGQVAYHLMVAAGMERAPWWITTLVACLPVAVLGMGAALAHLVREVELAGRIRATQDASPAVEIPAPAADLVAAPPAASEPVAEPAQVDAPEPDEPAGQRVRQEARPTQDVEALVRVIAAGDPALSRRRIAELAMTSEATVRRILGPVRARSERTPDAVEQVNGNVPELSGVRQP